MPDATSLHHRLQNHHQYSTIFVSVLFREVFSYPYISFFHLLVNGFCVTSFHTFFSKLLRVIHYYCTCKIFHC